MAKYILDSNKLEAGDIFLIKSSSEISQLVRRLTKSQYSHAILYVGASSAIESDGYGVQSQNIQRILFENKEDVVVLRLVSKEDLHKVAEAIVFARQKIGTEYSVGEAKLAMLKSELSAQEPNRQFCTRFVAQAYENAGVKLVDNPAYCNPEDLLQSKKLVLLDNMTREASVGEIDFAQSENPLTKQAEIHNLIFSEARRIFGKDIQTFEQLSEAIIEKSEKEPEFSKVLKDSGYLTMWQADCDKNPWYYDVRVFFERFENPQQAIETALFFATTENETRKRYHPTLALLKIGYNLKKQEYFKLMIALYEKLIELSYIRERVGLAVLKN